MKKSSRYTLNWFVVAAAVVLALTVAAAWLGSGWPTQRKPAASAPQGALFNVDATYAGQATLTGVGTGSFWDDGFQPSGTLSTPMTVDLGFLLNCTNGSLDGYVDLDSTLFFTGTNLITTTQAVTTPLAVGPAVHGTCRGPGTRFESERFSMVTDAGQSVMRQFRMVVSQTLASGFAGEYRETLWGYTPSPVTIVGEFQLDLVSGAGIAGWRVYMPVTRRN
jgi:hypothetical protein